MNAISKLPKYMILLFTLNSNRFVRLIREIKNFNGIVTCWLAVREHVHLITYLFPNLTQFVVMREKSSVLKKIDLNVLNNSHKNC
jgi:hypothetical protein